MSPISVLPGRIRVESQCLVGKERECRYFTERIKDVEGVLTASV
jgi:hypothetical protein